MTSAGIIINGVISEVNLCNINGQIVNVSVALADLEG